MVNRFTISRSILRGSLAGSAVAMLLLLVPEPTVWPIVGFALGVGVLTGLATFRREKGRASLPDGVLLLLFPGLTVFWGWVLLTGSRGMVIDHWLDAVAAAIVIGIPVGGAALVVWNRSSTGRHLLDDSSV
jgi:hypothetical protein